MIGSHGTADKKDAILDMVVSLIDQSLLHVQAAEENEEPRLMLLETIRAYGLELLKQSGEEQEIREAHARYYLAEAEKAAPKLMSVEQEHWFRLLEHERENIRAALSWFMKSHDSMAALRLSASIWFFWARLHAAEGYQWIERALLH